MRDVYKTQDVVKNTLIKYPETRNSDNVLYVRVCNLINPRACTYSFSYVLQHLSELGLPKVETVRRTRQKIQAENPELRASDRVTDGRYENYKVMKEYALND